MVKSRASVFDETPEIDLTAFAPKPRAADLPSPEKVRAVSEAANFRSREAAAAPAPSAPPPATEKPRARRHRTGRNVQLNIKASPETVADFYAITDTHKGWSLSYTFERAIAALKHELETQRELEKLS